MTTTAEPTRRAHGPIAPQLEQQLGSDGVDMERVARHDRNALQRVADSEGEAAARRREHAATACGVGIEPGVLHHTGQADDGSVVRPPDDPRWGTKTRQPRTLEQTENGVAPRAAVPVPAMGPVIHAEIAALEEDLKAIDLHEDSGASYTAELRAQLSKQLAEASAAEKAIADILRLSERIVGSSRERWEKSRVQLFKAEAAMEDLIRSQRRRNEARSHREDYGHTQLGYKPTAETEAAKKAVELAKSHVDGMEALHQHALRTVKSTAIDFLRDRVARLNASTAAIAAELKLLEFPQRIRQSLSTQLDTRRDQLAAT